MDHYTERQTHITVLLLKMQTDLKYLIFTAAAAVTIGIYINWHQKRKYAKLPGPPGQLFVGNALQFDNPNEQLITWAQQYGDIFRLNLFGKDVVVVNSLKGITEVMLTKSDEFSGRPKGYRWSLLVNEDINLNDFTPKCILMKKLCMVGIKQFGEKLQQLEDLITEATNEFFEKLASCRGQEIDMRTDIMAVIAHITFMLSYGRGLSSTDQKEFMEVERCATLHANPTQGHIELDLFPWLRGPWYSGYRKTMIVCNRINSFYMRHTKQTIADHNENDMNCALDGLVKERNRAMKSGEKDFLTMENLKCVGMDLTIAGSGTTSSALYYLILLLTSDQKLQSEVHAEVINVIGQRPPTIKDRTSLPFIESLIFELLRLMSHAPVSVPHKTVTDTTLLGHLLPKGTEVWPNLWYLHHNEELWEDPWKFKPRRFLDNQGKLILADHPLRKQFLAFGAGRRVCVGESLAKNRLFLFITSLAQRIRFLPVEGESYQTDPRTFRQGFVLTAQDYKVKIDLWGDHTF